MDIQDSHSLSRIAYSKNILERYYAHYIIVLEIYYIANKDKHNQVLWSYIPLSGQTEQLC